MKEEDVTKIILDWLESNGWTIVCYDFPQSGTGILLHLNNKNRTEKNKGGIIPDIIAVKNERALFFENKDRFYEPDFDKLNEIKTTLKYSDALDKLLFKYKTKEIYYGVSFPNIDNEKVKSNSHLHKIDFLVLADMNKKVHVHFDLFNLF